MNQNNNLSKGEIRKEFVNEMAKLLGERNDSVNLALSGIVPILFDKIQKFLAQEETPGHFLELLNDSDDINEDNTSPADLIEQTDRGSATQKLLSMILPEQNDRLASVISTVSDISPSSGKTLLSVGASLLFSVLRNYLRQMRIQSLSLKDWMDDINYDADVMLPEQFRSYFVNQKSSSAVALTSSKPANVSQAQYNKNPKRNLRWLWWLVLGCVP